MGNYTIITDAWDPQINGVVTTYKNTLIDKNIVSGEECIKVPIPGYREISLAINPWRIRNRLVGDNIHIATEGPLGLFARLYLKSYTSSYHSKFPEFLEKRLGIPAKFFYPYFRWFHSKSKAVLVPSRGMADFLISKGFKNLKVWTRGVDFNKFYPEKKPSLDYIVCVSRASQEKGLDAFCALRGYRKILVGEGPYLNSLKQRYPDVEFVGKKTGEDLRQYYANASCFVFPSYEDTFGVVLLEAIACGTPVASVPSYGADEVLTEDNGVIDANLQAGINKAILLDRDKVYTSSLKWTWERATSQFVKALEKDL